MTGAQPCLLEVGLHLGVEFQKPHGVGHRRTALANAFADLFLSEAKLLGQTLVGRRLLNRIESLALEVFDEGQLQNFLVACLSDDDWCFGETDFQGGAHAPLSGDQFVFSAGDADDERLDDAALANRFDQIAELIVAELCPRLQGAGNDLVEPDLLDALTLFNGGNSGRNTGVDECSKAFAQTLSETSFCPVSGTGGRCAGLWHSFIVEHPATCVEEKGVVVREEVFTLCGMFEELDLIMPDECFDGPMQMALDEALLSSVTKPTLRIYRWSSPWVTFGYFQKHAEVLLSYPGMPCVRRWTGGGMVEHGRDNTFSLMIPKGYPAAVVAPSIFYSKLHALIANWLRKELSFSVGMVSGEEVLQGSSCFTAPAKDDLLLGGRKILGGAQRRCAGALLYQGSLQGLEIDVLKVFPAALLDGELPIITPLSGSLIEKAESLSKTRYGCPNWNTRR